VFRWFSRRQRLTCFGLRDTGCFPFRRTLFEEFVVEDVDFGSGWHNLIFLFSYIRTLALGQVLNPFSVAGNKFTNVLM
jgi:hypothetical protein